MSADPVGTTALDIVVPEADALVRTFRNQEDPGAAIGMPAHVTVLYPWQVDPDDDVLDALRQMFATRPAFELVFARSGRFPDVLYLEPEPAAPVSALIHDVVRRWPEFPPYGGTYGADPTPHLTLARGAPATGQDASEAALRDELPIRSAVTNVVMHRFDGHRWSILQRFALGVIPG